MQVQVINVFHHKHDQFTAIRHNKQGVEGLQAFAFCLLTVNNEHTR